ncbi:MAG TPA: copper-binding protein [Thermoanaerobaculia bacterium]|nr:copper-binding protein [Thermoanaerobaculia bacterium]
MRRNALALVLLGAAALTGGVGCGREKMAPADAIYSTRGQVVEMPGDSNGELSVHHETVADFRDRDGKPSHMDSMSMPFAVAPEVSLAGIAPGDKVAMTFEVRWDSLPTLRVIKLSELPESTALNLGGPTLEFVAPLGSSKPVPSPTPTTPPANRPAGDAGSAPPSSTI